jgi:hypothetical protein
VHQEETQQVGPVAHCINGTVRGFGFLTQSKLQAQQWDACCKHTVTVCDCMLLSPIACPAGRLHPVLTSWASTRRSALPASVVPQTAQHTPALATASQACPACWWWIRAPAVQQSPRVRAAVRLLSAVPGLVTAHPHVAHRTAVNQATVAGRAER